MIDWLEGIAGPGFASAVLWTLLALVLLVIVLVIIKIVRSMTFGTYVVGGRNRKTRLAVMDAAAVDSHRRLVLVRRDDVEHLLLIGGPTDVVVEQHIRVAGGVPQQVRRPGPPEGSPEPAPRRPQQAPAPVPQQRLPEPAVRAAAPAQTQRAANPPSPARASTPPAPTTARGTDTRSQYRLPPANPNMTVAEAIANKRTVTAAPAPDDLDLELQSEIESSLAEETKPKPALSLEDEMNKLLGELGSPKKK